MLLTLVWTVARVARGICLLANCLLVCRLPASGCAALHEDFFRPKCYAIRRRSPGEVGGHRGLFGPSVFARVFVLHL
jgi:hypothetical protein